jgi:hypothetical protein
LQIPLIPGNGPDILGWKPSTDGQCSSKSAHKALKLEEVAESPPRNIPSQALQILEEVWRNKTIQPRVKTFAWRLLRLALGTASRVHKIIPNVDDTCSCCGQPENEKKLFFDCSFARAIWFGSPIQLKSDALPSSNRGLHSQIAIILKEGPSQATAGMIFSILLVPLEGSK